MEQVQAQSFHLQGTGVGRPGNAGATPFPTPYETHAPRAEPRGGAGVADLITSAIAAGAADHGRCGRIADRRAPGLERHGHRHRHRQPGADGAGNAWQGEQTVPDSACPDAAGRIACLVADASSPAVDLAGHTVQLACDCHLVETACQHAVAGACFRAGVSG